MRSFFDYESDDRIKSAKELLQDFIDEHQSYLDNSPLNSSTLLKSYSKLLKQYGNDRGGALFFPYLSAGISSDAKVRLADGSIKYDMINGIGVHPGHHLPLFFEATWRSLFVDTIMQGNLQQHYRSAFLANEFCKLSHMDHCFLTSSGAMATENALKMMFQKHAPAQRLLAFEHCFIGRTLGLASITDKALYRDGLPTTLTVDYVPFYNPKDPKSLEKSISTIQRYLTRYPNQYAGMCIELIQGEGGYNVGTKEYFNSLIQVLKDNGLCVFIDEIQTFGRTESLFAHHYFELSGKIDILTVGKLSQVCATMFKTNYKPNPGLVSQTFTSSTTAIEAALLLLEELSTKPYYGPNGIIAQIHRHFVKHFKRLQKKYKSTISGPFGHGGMIACTLFDGDRDKTMQFLKTLYKNGVIAFVCGQSPTRIRMIPPIMVCSNDVIDSVMDIFEQSLQESL